MLEIYDYSKLFGNKPAVQYSDVQSSENTVVEKNQTEIALCSKRFQSNEDLRPLFFAIYQFYFKISSGCTYHMGYI